MTSVQVLFNKQNFINGNQFFATKSKKDQQKSPVLNNGFAISKQEIAMLTRAIAIIEQRMAMMK
jgi:hypothetical protein